SITDQRGNGIELQYEEHASGGQLWLVQDRRGWRFRLEYTEGRISTVYLERAGLTPREPAQVLTGVRYGYHRQGGELGAVTDGDGGVSYYEYDGWHRLV